MQIISTAVNLQYTESSEGTEFIWNIEYIKQEGGKRKLSAFYFWLWKEKIFLPRRLSVYRPSDEKLRGSKCRKSRRVGRHAVWEFDF